MSLVRINNESSVEANFVSSIKINRLYDTITVRMQDGEEFHMSREYNKTIWETYDRTVKLIGEGQGNG